MKVPNLQKSQTGSKVAVRKPSFLAPKMALASSDEGNTENIIMNKTCSNRNVTKGSEASISHQNSSKNASQENVPRESSLLTKKRQKVDYESDPSEDMFLDINVTIGGKEENFTSKISDSCIHTSNSQSSGDMDFQEE